MNTLNKLQNIFREIFDTEDLAISEFTSSNDIDDWDSYAQINIIVACESEFNIKFDLNEIDGLITVGDFINAIERKLLS
jgi:acyl carrier protein